MKNLFAVSLLAVALVGCGGSSSSSDPAPEALPAPEEVPAITAQDVQVMQNVLDQANAARTELDVLQAVPQKVPFLARLNIGEEQLLATQGDLSFKASCIDLNEGSGEPDAELEVTYISTVAGALSTEEGGYIDQNVDYVFTSNSSVSDIDIDQGSVTSPSGDSISINGETMLLSANAQGTDCMVAGIALVMKGSAAGEFTLPNAELPPNPEEM